MVPASSPLDVSEGHTLPRGGWSVTALLLALSCGLLVMTLALIGIAAWWNWKSDFHEATELARGVARLTANQTARMVEAADLVLRQMVERTTQMDWSNSEADLAMLGELSEFSTLLPYADSLFIFDREGRVRATSLADTVSEIDVSDRTYFKVHEADPNVGLYISSILRERTTGTLFFALTRGVYTPAGEFDGVVSFTLNPDGLRNFYRRLDIRHDAVFKLIGRDMTVLVREPMLEPNPGEPVDFDLQQSIALSSSGVREYSMAGDVERIWAYQQVGEYPLFAAIGLSRVSILEHWRDQTMPYLLMSAVALSAFLFMTLIAMRRARNEDRFRAALARANAELEQRVAERTVELESLLKQRETLVREVHHRVKNNLQVIASLLSLQARSVDEDLMPYFDESIRRIAAMGQIHQMLYSADNVVGLNVGSYLEGLCSDIVRSYGAAERVQCDISADAVTLDLDVATPLALIVAEIISNALKHGFPDNRRGRITIRLERADGKISLAIHDDGVGMQKSQAIGKSRSMGMKLVETLARQLEAELTVTGNDGTLVTIAFPDPAVAGRQTA